MIEHPIELAIELPERTRVALGQSKPRATLVFTTPEGGEERMGVPVALAKRLQSKLDDDALEASSRAELMHLIGEHARSCAMERIAALVNMRDYSEHDFKRKLRLDGYASSTVEACVQRAKELRLIDDRRYADAYIRSKVSQGWGRSRIERELSAHGIAAADVAGWPEEYLSGDAEAERAYELAKRRPLKGSNDYERLMRYLCGRGYAPGVASSAVNRVLAEAAATADEPLDGQFS